MKSIPKTGTDVDAKRLSDIQSANNHQRSAASAESIEELSGVSSKSSARQNSTAQNLKEKTSFSMLLIFDGHRVESTGEHKRCLCPFHAENTASFMIFNDSYAKCFGCGWHGD